MNFFDNIVNINNTIRETISSALNFQTFNISPNVFINVNEGTALLIDDTSVTVNNQGQVFGDFNSVSFAESGAFAELNNSGTISSDSRAVNIAATGVDIDNSGVIVATATQRNGTIYSDDAAQSFSLNNSGIIDAGIGLEGAAVSIELSAEGNTIDIDNSGQIFGTGNAAAGTAAAGDGIRLERSRVDGNLDGSTTGLFDGTITNSGLITAEDGANGTVAGFRAVNGVDFQGELVNEAGGTISGIQNGVYFGNATSADYVFVNGVNGVVDAGQGNDGSGVSLQVGDNVCAVVVNDGLIQGQGDSAVANQIGHGLRLFSGAGDDSTFEGVIVNFGTIQGSNQSNDASTADGVNILNAGQINGDVILSAGDDIFVLTAEGTIEGTVYGGEGFDTISLIGYDQGQADALFESGQLSGFENVVFGDDFGFSGFAAAPADASFFNGDEDFINDNDLADNLDELADLAMFEANFAY